MLDDIYPPICSLYANPEIGIHIDITLHIHK
jgi:hypothetical protein